MLHQKEFRGPFATLDGAGRFFSYTEHTSPSTDPRIRLWVDGQPVGILYPGEAFELDRVSDRWDIEPLGGANATGRVLIGNATFRTGRLPQGVELWRGAAADTMRGQEFIGGASRTAAASLFAAVGVASLTTTIAVRLAVAVGSGAAVLRSAICTGAASAPLSTQKLANKLAGGAVAVAELQALDLAAADPATIAGVSAAQVLEVPLAVQTRAVIDTSRNTAPVILPKGFSLWFVNTTAAAGLSVLVEVAQL